MSNALQINVPHPDVKFLVQVLDPNRDVQPNTDNSYSIIVIKLTKARMENV